MSIFVIRQLDTLPILQTTLLLNRLPVNLAGATVTFRFQDAADAISTTVATVVDAAAGLVSHAFTATQTAIAGTASGEFIVDFGGGDIETFPRAAPLTVSVVAILT